MSFVLPNRMFSCCFVGSGISKTQSAALQEKLLQAKDALPSSGEAAGGGSSSTTFALLDGKGRVLLRCGGNEEDAAALERRLPALRGVASASSALSGALQEHSCPAVHIKGLRSLLTQYDLGRGQQLFIMCTGASPQAVELLDLGALDVRLAPLLLQIRDILDG